MNTTDDSREGIARYLSRNPNTCFVAEENGNIIGVIMSGHDGRRGFIYHTAVRQEYRRQGIGKKLVGSAMAARGPRVYRNKNIHELKGVDLNLK